ncbi:MAG: hypothetical protein FJ403_02585 [Verrucomicrobia bacterium]|nr:hypothetical protein [Verrucomicrobiota bacterium]
MILDPLERLMIGRTTFMIAHRLSTLRHAGLILVLHHGQLVERGTQEELPAASCPDIRRYSDERAGWQRTESWSGANNCTASAALPARHVESHPLNRG